jgi:hypothetical protein
MARLTGWKRLLAEPDWCRGDGRFPLPAYSEFLPPPWVALKPYSGPDPYARDPNDNWGWNVSEYEQAFALRPGLQAIARAALDELTRLGRGQPTPGLSRRKLADNPYWPADLQAHARAGKLGHERYVVLLALALTRTQDDKGRVPWSLCGCSEQGPALPFWKGFYSAPGRPLAAERGLALFRRLLTEVYHVPEALAQDPVRAGLRVLPAGEDEQFPFWGREPFPPWCEELLWDGRGSVRRVKFLLTFRPFARLPSAVPQAYVAGELHLWPFPGSLLFWGATRYRELQRQLPLAAQIPLLHLLPRCRGPGGVRVPQSGWLHEHAAGLAAEAAHTPVRPHFQRTHRWQPIARDLDETAMLEGADHVARVLFSTDPTDLGLYDKPMARNAQLWDGDYRLLLDGPRAGRDEIHRAVRALERGGQFGYRFTYPALRVGPWEVYWQLPLAAVPSDDPARPTVLQEGPTGYLTAYRADAPDLADPVELWPRLLDRPAERLAAELFAHETHPRKHLTALNVRSLLEYHALLGGGPLPRPLARALLECPKKHSLEDWLTSLPERASDPARAENLSAELRRRLAPPDEFELPGASLTFAATALRRFEVTYWKTIALLAHGKYRNKDNADCVQDEPTRKALRHHHRDLEPLGEYLMRRHALAIRRAGLQGQAWVGEHAFHWRTDFDFPWSGGWARNQDGRAYERNIVVRIPGRDPSRAVIMADHYDTAYEADRYDPRYGGTGARVAAAGADDNHSATAALLLAAPVLLGLSKAERLGCDVWLVHLTGEEFPADCMGARNLCRALVEGNLRVREFRGGERDLSGVRVKGVYVSDMIAHNNDRERSVFQIAPGEGAASAWLALQAHRANEAWNALARERNRKAPRHGRGRAKRVKRGQRVPPLAEHAVLRGEIRPEWDPRSTLYNTDGQIFSDVGVPVVLFMEDYDINRSGYHDTKDTLANIDLDYGAALAAIVIESVARAAASEP